MLRSYFYQFSLTNWPIAILFHSGIHALDEYRITIDPDDVRANVIYQIFQANGDGKRDAWLRPKLMRHVEFQ